MSRLSAAYRTVAQTSQHHHAETAGVTIQRLGQSATATSDATIYSERVEHRRGDGRTGDRQRVYTRKLVLPPGEADVPIGSFFTVGTLDYVVETATRSTASGSQILGGTRTTVEQTSRPSAWS